MKLSYFSKKSIYKIVLLTSISLLGNSSFGTELETLEEALGALELTTQRRLKPLNILSASTPCLTSLAMSSPTRSNYSPVSPAGGLSIIRTGTPSLESCLSLPVVASLQEEARPEEAQQEEARAQEARQEEVRHEVPKKEVQAPQQALQERVDASVYFSGQLALWGDLVHASLTSASLQSAVEFLASKECLTAHPDLLAFENTPENIRIGHPSAVPALLPPLEGLLKTPEKRELQQKLHKLLYTWGTDSSVALDLRLKAFALLIHSSHSPLEPSQIAHIKAALMGLLKPPEAPLAPAQQELVLDFIAHNVPAFSSEELSFLTEESSRFSVECQIQVLDSLFPKEPGTLLQLVLNNGDTAYPFKKRALQLLFNKMGESKKGREIQWIFNQIQARRAPFDRAPYIFELLSFITSQAPSVATLSVQQTAADILEAIIIDAPRRYAVDERRAALMLLSTVTTTDRTLFLDMPTVLELGLLEPEDLPEVAVPASSVQGNNVHDSAVVGDVQRSIDVLLEDPEPVGSFEFVLPAIRHAITSLPTAELFITPERKVLALRALECMRAYLETSFGFSGTPLGKIYRYTWARVQKYTLETADQGLINFFAENLANMFDSDGHFVCEMGHVSNLIMSMQPYYNDIQIGPTIQDRAEAFIHTFYLRRLNENTPQMTLLKEMTGKSSYTIAEQGALDAFKEDLRTLATSVYGTGAEALRIRELYQKERDALEEIEWAALDGKRKVLVTSTHRMSERTLQRTLRAIEVWINEIA